MRLIDCSVVAYFLLGHPGTQYITACT